MALDRLQWMPSSPLIKLIMKIERMKSLQKIARQLLKPQLPMLIQDQVET